MPYFPFAPVTRSTIVRGKTATLSVINVSFFPSAHGAKK